MIKLIRAALVGGAMLLVSLQASALMMTYDFYKLTNTNVENLGSQLSMTVWDYAEANSTFGLSLTSLQVLFTVQNNVGTASNISEVYFDDGLLGPSFVYNSLGGYTDFTGGGANPPGLPAGGTATPPFVTSTTFSADVSPGNPTKGVNTNADILGIRLGLGSFADYNGVIGAVDSGDLRFGLHVRSIGIAGGSDSYINNPPVTSPPDPPDTNIPVPGTLLLAGLALVGLAWSLRRRSS